ncbi:MAG: succinylglutamate-semialdehyde dehydrogenase [Hyphomonadaceae bacterium]
MKMDVYLNGTWTSGEGVALSNMCPATGETVWSGNAASAEQVAQAVEVSRNAFPAWARRSRAERVTVLERYAEAIKARTDKIAEAISRDMGKAKWESLGEVGAMVGKVAISIRAQAERAGDRNDEAAFGNAELTHRPHGVMAVLGPFNFPGHLPNGHIVPALLAGNTCVFKPSEQAPSVAALIVEAFEEAGLPAGCLNVVHGARETGGALINGDIDGLLFTGSAATGTFFHKHFAGRPEVILALEMGGNNPLIIWDAENVDAAADIAALSAFYTTGQRCSCARRLILPEGEYGDAVVEAVVARARELTIGAWNEPDIFMGPLVSEQAAESAVTFQMNLSKAGGKSLRRLKRLERGGGFVSAGVIDMTNAKPVEDEELFGPLLQIYRVPNFEAAIDRANATRYGLSGGLVSDNDALWSEASLLMRAGILNRNRPTAGASGSMPFGGPGHSGNFRPGAYYAADYCAWPQASQISSKANRMTAQGFPK